MFGEISTGKSALINALAARDVAGVSVRGGWTKEVWRLDWEAPATVAPGLGESELVLVDTPGLNEVDGAAAGRHGPRRRRAGRPRAAGHRQRPERDRVHSALEQIASLHKPVLLVVNKTDLYTRRGARGTDASRSPRRA